MGRSAILAAGVWGVARHVLGSDRPSHDAATYDRLRDVPRPVARVLLQPVQ
jgi:hypothetical protein